jgi:hypothetical protein
VVQFIALVVAIVINWEVMLIWEAGFLVEEELCKLGGLVKRSLVFE